MLGAIIGDTIGSAYEFNNTKDYDFRLFTSESSFTDDSVMTLAVAHWLLRDPKHTHARLEEMMVEYAKRYPCPMGGYGTGFYRWLFEPGARKPYNSWGNGSAMRASAVGWFFDTLEETEEVAAISASITHNHPEGIKGAQATAAAIWMVRNGKDKEEIRSYIENRFGYDLHRTWEQLHPVYGWDSSCQGTVPEAIIAFLDSISFEDAIRKAVSLGGDSDTLACITGGIAEAYYINIPNVISATVAEKLPYEFRAVILEMAASTAYGRVCPIPVVAEADPTGRRGRVTPRRIENREPQVVFVFGSNIDGFHAGGAARIAHERFGAVWGQGVGMQGMSYAIPTMGDGIESIRPYVDEFIRYARKHTGLRFLVTRIGCGIAGYTDDEIAPLFRKAVPVENISLPEEFWTVLA